MYTTSSKNNKVAGAKPSPPAALPDPAEVPVSPTPHKFDKPHALGKKQTRPAHANSHRQHQHHRASHTATPSSTGAATVTTATTTTAATDAASRTKSTSLADAQSRALVQEYWNSVKRSSREPPLYHTLSDRYGGTQGIPYASRSRSRDELSAVSARNPPPGTNHVQWYIHAAKSAMRECQLHDAVALLHAALAQLQNTDGGLSISALAASARTQVKPRAHDMYANTARSTPTREEHDQDAHRDGSDCSHGQDARGAYTGEVLRCLAQLDMLRGRYSDALRHLTLSSAADPLPSETYALCAACYEALGTPHMAHAEYEKYMKLSAPSLEVLAHCGKCAAESGSYDAAERYLTQLLHRISIPHVCNGADAHTHTHVALATASSLRHETTTPQKDDQGGANRTHGALESLSVRRRSENATLGAAVCTDDAFYAAHAHFYLGVICDERVRAMQQQQQRSKLSVDGDDDTHNRRCGRDGDGAHGDDNDTHDARNGTPATPPRANRLGDHNAPGGNDSTPLVAHRSSDDALTRMRAEAAVHYRHAACHRHFVRAYEQAAESAMCAANLALAYSLLQSLQRMRPEHARYACQFAEVCARRGDVPGQLSALSAALDRQQDVLDRRTTLLTRGNLYQHVLRDMDGAIADYTLVILESPERPGWEGDGCTLMAHLRRADAFGARNRSAEDGAAALRDFWSFLRMYECRGDRSREAGGRRRGLASGSPLRTDRINPGDETHPPAAAAAASSSSSSCAACASAPEQGHGHEAKSPRRWRRDGAAAASKDDVLPLGVTRDALEQDVTRAMVALALGAYDAAQFGDSVEYFARAIARGWRPVPSLTGLPGCAEPTHGNDVRRNAPHAESHTGEVRVVASDTNRDQTTCPVADNWDGDRAEDVGRCGADTPLDVLHKMYIALAQYVMLKYPIEEDVYKTMYEPREWMFPPDTRRPPLRSTDRRETDRPYSNTSSTAAPTAFTPSLACLIVETRYGVLRAAEPTLWSSLESAFLELWEPYHTELERMREESATRLTGRRSKRHGLL